MLILELLLSWLAVALHILAFLALLLFLRYCILICKRLSLLHRLQKLSVHPISFARGRLFSVFRTDGRQDLTLRIGKESHSISLITTPFRRVRYHFSPTHLELYYERASTVTGRWVLKEYNRRSYVLRRCPLSPPEATRGEDARVYIIHPAPRLLSMVVGNKQIPLSNGDFLYGGIIACGARWYMENAEGLGKRRPPKAES